MKIKNKNILLFPIDTVSRELEWQLILALESAKRYRAASIIGHKYFIKQIHKKSKHCILIGRPGSPHGFHKGDLAIFKEGNRNKTTFLYLHDEGGFYSLKNYEATFLSSLPVENARQSEKLEFLVWGEDQKRILEKVAQEQKFEVKARLVGMPRFDLYKKEWAWLDEKAVKRLQDEYGTFTLIITKFGNANSNEYKSGQISQGFLKEFRVIDDDAKIDYFYGIWNKDYKDFSDFVSMLRQVFKAFPEKQFILRPHPSEDAVFYQQVFGYYANVKVIRKGDVRLWIKACREMVHSGCTTGVEGILSGKRVINYTPNGTSPYDVVIAHEAGLLARKPEDVIEFLADTTKHIAIQFSQSSIRKLYNLEHNSFPVFYDLLAQHLNNQQSASVEIDSLLLRNLRLLKYRYQREKLIKQRTGSSGEAGRRVRLSDLPLKRIEEVVAAFNQRNDFKAKVKPLSSIGIIVEPGER